MMRLARSRRLDVQLGVLLLTLSVPLLIWQMDPANQISIGKNTFLALHSMMEVFAVIVAAQIFFTGYGAHEFSHSLRSVMLGFAFLAVALFDLFHFLSYIGMPDLVSPNTPHKAILLWLAARFTAALGFMAYFAIPELRTIGPKTRQWWLLLVIVATAGLSWPLLAGPEEMPAMFIVGQGLTPLKIGLEWSIFLLYAGAAALLFVRRHNVGESDVPRLLIGLGLLCMGELFFTMYVQVTNTANLLGHAYKVFAYYFFYRAIFVESVRRPFLRMENMLLMDNLTGLSSRHAFNVEIEKTVMDSNRKGASFAVILFGLDHFQAVNDTLGHEQGDALLRAVAGRVKQTLPEAGFMGRLGGDVFVAIVQDGDVDKARHLARRMAAAMDEAFLVGEDRLDVTASFGIVSYPIDGDSASELMRHADLALHKAKSAGRNCITVFSRDLSETIQRRVLLESRLKLALQHNELSLHYQPRLDLGSNRITGWEALVRWRSPELGMVSPGEFIPVAEETGLILPLGDWVLHEACRQAVEWQDAGLPIMPVAVNLSARQFRQRDLCEKIRQTLERTGLPVELLNIEVTESAIVDSVSSATSMLAELRALGVKVALDDFGTGYSSLSYLKHFPLNCLKIDQSFVRDLPHDESGMAIVRAIIGLGESLGLSVVAEGVETEEQKEYLRQNHCHEMQGYLFSRPLPAADCPELMRSHA